MLQTLRSHFDQEWIYKHVLAFDPAERNGPCVSIYLPRQEPGTTPAQRKFRLLRLIKAAERIIARDFGAAEAKALLDSLRKTRPLRLVEESADALALFHEKEFTGALHLPTEVPERVVVARSFHIKPLISWLQFSQDYYLISLSAREVNLFHGTAWSLTRIKTIPSPWIREEEVAPRMAANGVALDTRPARRRLRLREGAQRLDGKERLRQFFLRAEAEIYPITSRDRHPVVIAGVSYLHPIFREVNRDLDLVSHAIYGNVERWTASDLRGAAREILHKLFDGAKAEAVAEYERHAPQGRALDDLTKIARAAVAGKVRKILIAEDSLLWGRLDANTGSVRLHPRQGDSADDDVLDDLAETVLSHGGKVLCLPKSELPTRSPVAALLSY